LQARTLVPAPAGQTDRLIRDLAEHDIDRMRTDVVMIMTMTANEPHTPGRRRRLHRAHPRLTPLAFELLVEETLDALPPWVQGRLAEVAVVVDAEPPAHEDPHLLGLYTGPTLFAEPSLAAPPLIRIFQGPHERMCRTRRELRREVAETVLHEIAHRFGLDEGDIARLGSLRLPERRE
jgi:predicted Zn-dependent protease with MMP-like domain